MCFGGKSAQQMYEEMKPEPQPLPSLSMDSVAEGATPEYKDVLTPQKGKTQRPSLLSNPTNPMSY